MSVILDRICSLAAFSLLALAGCGSKAAGEGAPAEPEPLLAADMPELEIRANGIDRFTTCPPPGDLGQHWIPNIPGWAPPPATPDAAPSQVDGLIVRTADRTTAEMASEATHHDFRSCYRQGLVHHPTQDGRVAIIVRVDGAGRVAKVESYGACELAPESLECMVGVAKKLRFAPPPGGSDTVTLPATFTSRDGVRRTEATPNDAYTAGAYVTLDAARPRLHACDDAARVAQRPVQATGTFSLEIRADGHVQKSYVDPWSGDRALLQCAARVLEGLTFPATGGGDGGNSPPTSRVIARLNFNPRQGTR